MQIGFFFRETLEIAIYEVNSKSLEKMVKRSLGKITDNISTVIWLQSTVQRMRELMEQQKGKKTQFKSKKPNETNRRPKDILSIYRKSETVTPTISILC